MLEDFVVVLSAGVSAFFVVMSLVLMVRYRKLTVDVNESARLASDIWDALEERLRKQDDRIVDVMARMELYGVQSSRQASLEIRRSPSHNVTRLVTREPEPMIEGFVEAAPEELLVARPGQRRESNRLGGGITIAETEVKVLRALLQGPKTSIEINRLIGMTREHAARLMKNLFVSGMVVRNEEKKPYVYQITNVGISQTEKNASETEK